MIAEHIACAHREWPARYHPIAAPLLHAAVIPPADVAWMLEKGTCAPVFETLHAFPMADPGMFIKLGGFSFRGHPAFDLTAGQIRSRDDLALLCSSLPGRIRWAMHQCAKIGADVTLDAFVWRPIPPDSELRLTVRQGSLSHCALYHHPARPPDSAVVAFAQQVFEWMRPDLPLSNCLIDLTTHHPNAPLIEINPAV